MNPDNTPAHERSSGPNGVALLSPSGEILEVSLGGFGGKEQREHMLVCAWDRHGKSDPNATYMHDEAVDAALAEGFRVEKVFIAVAGSRGLRSIFSEITKERDRADEKWGGPEHDDDKTIDDWHSTISDYNGWARRMACMNSPEKARRRYLQLAALAVAAVQSIDRCLEGQPTQEVE